MRRTKTSFFVANGISEKHVLNGFGKNSSAIVHPRLATEIDTRPPNSLCASGLRQIHRILPSRDIVYKSVFAVFDMCVQLDEFGPPASLKMGRGENKALFNYFIDYYPIT